MADSLDLFALWKTDYANASAATLEAINHQISVELGFGMCPGLLDLIHANISLLQDLQWDR